MRVIAGKARRTQLKTIEGMDTRPTTDRIKETLFNMINNELYDCMFLDLFSGSGGIGIEALSRGARKAVFVENNKKAVMCIKENLEKTHFSLEGEVWEDDVIRAIRKAENNNMKFDFIFMDPPYNRLIEKEVLTRLKDSTILNEDTTIIVEASMETDFDYLYHMGYELIKRKEYKSNVHMFLKLK